MYDNEVKLNDVKRPDLKIERILARVGKWMYLELSDGQRVFGCQDNAEDPADCPVSELMNLAEAPTEEEV
jgi:hypothetical protein